MGDFGSSDCSWKKMVIAKANNEWISTIKSEQIEEDNTASTNNFSLGDEQTSYNNLKLEHEEANAAQSYLEPKEDPISIQGMKEDAMTLIHQIDPYLEPMKRTRRKGSVPKCESPEERASRLAKMSAYAAQRLANESPEQRALRLKRMSEYAARRLAQETSEQRAKRLARMSAYAAKRLAKETPEQRQARLSRMSAYAARRQAMKKVSPSTSESLDPTNLTYNITNNVMPNQS